MEKNNQFIPLILVNGRGHVIIQGLTYFLLNIFQWRRMLFGTDELVWINFVVLLYKNSLFSTVLILKKAFSTLPFFPPSK